MVIGSRERLYWIFLAFIIVTCFVIKFVALNKYMAPPSPDYGNYLRVVDVLRGYDVEGYGLRYNPIFFILLDLLLRLFDEFTALKIAASLVFSMVAIPFSLLAKKLTNNHFASLIGTWLFVFSEEYSEMIAWGGNPNFLGFSFMLVAVLFIMNAFEEPSKKNILLTGFSMSLIVGTHFLVAIFMVATLCILTVLAVASDKGNVGKNLKVLLASSIVGIVFSLPYSLVYLNSFNTLAGGLLEPNFLMDLNGVDLTWLFRQSFAVVIIAGLGIFALSRYLKRNRSNGLILVALFLAPFFLAFITKLPGRWFYLLPIPIMICFSLYLRDLLAVVTNKRKEILSLFVCFILIIGVETTISSINRLGTAVDFYQNIGGSEIQALNWIQENTELNAVFATSGPNRMVGGGGNAYAWWIEGLSKRKCVHTGSTEYYTFEDQRREVSVVNRVFAGAYVFENGKVRISEAFPSDMGNPEFAVNINGDYQNVLFLNDGKLELIFSPAENPDAVWRESPFYAKTKTVYINRNDTWINATFTYEWDYMKFVRNVIIRENDSSADVTFRIYPLNSYFREFNIRIWGSFFTSFESYEIDDLTVSLSQRIPVNKILKTQVVLSDTNGVVNNAQVLFRDPEYSMPVVIYSLKPLTENLYVKIRLSAATYGNRQPLQAYNSYDLIKQLGVNYIFLNKDRISEYLRFIRDPRFILKFENEKIVIFQVASGAES